MAKKYYVVWQGRETGIFTTWAKCQSLVDGFAGQNLSRFQHKRKRSRPLEQHHLNPT